MKICPIGSADPKIEQWIGEVNHIVPGFYARSAYELAENFLRYRTLWKLLFPLTSEREIRRLDKLHKRFKSQRVFSLII